MAKTTYPYNPDYAIPPGWLLEEYLEVRNLSYAEFARLCSRSPKLISKIISGKAPIEPETAMQFERVLGLDATIWLGIEAEFWLYKAYKKEAKRTARRSEWIKIFPIDELVKRGIFQKPESMTDAISKLHTFFGARTADAWDSRYKLGNVAYKQSSTFKSKKTVVATWLRLGELQGEQQKCADYNEKQFKNIVQQEVRNLTRLPINEAFKRATRLCNKAGVALVAVPPFKKMALSGAAWWMNPKSPIIQLSLRHKSNNHFWFTFFHEAAHIVLHSKKTIFLDGKDDSQIDDEERQADEWAANTLVPKKAWRGFVAEFQGSAQEVINFAKQQGIASGIVVGRLQYEKVVPWSHLNDLKEKYEWQD